MRPAANPRRPVICPQTVEESGFDSQTHPPADRRSGLDTEYRNIVLLSSPGTGKPMLEMRTDVVVVGTQAATLSMFCTTAHELETAGRT
jgi:hypothetical protein